MWKVVICFSQVSLRLKCLMLLTIDRPPFLAEGTFESIAAVISYFRFIFTGLIGRVLVFTLLCFWRLPFFDLRWETAVGWTLIPFLDFPANIEPKFWNTVIFSETFIPFHKLLQSFIEFGAGSRTNLSFNRFSKVFKLFSKRLRWFNFRSLVINKFTTGQTNIHLINATVLIDGELCNLWRLWLWTWVDCIIEGIF